jgi:CheY-like chemotaxis protein
LSVLVVDDDERVRELTARVLEIYGHRAVTAGSAEAALERVESDQFDTILTDVVLGREDGLEILAQLRRLQPNARAIVMSGFIPSPERLDALRGTDIVFLPKPFSGAALQAAIATPAAGESVDVL